MRIGWKCDNAHRRQAQPPAVASRLLHQRRLFCASVAVVGASRARGFRNPGQDGLQEEDAGPSTALAAPTLDDSAGCRRPLLLLEEVLKPPHLGGGTHEQRRLLVDLSGRRVVTGGENWSEEDQAAAIALAGRGDPPPVLTLAGTTSRTRSSARTPRVARPPACGAGRRSEQSRRSPPHPMWCSAHARRPSGVIACPEDTMTPAPALR